MLATELAQQMEKPKVELPQPYADFRDVFEKKTIDELPPSRTFDHTIELNKGFSPKVAKVYSLNPKEQEACRVFIASISSPGRSFHPSPHKHHHFSLYQRRMDL